MEIEAISGASAVALTSTIVFLLVARAWTSVSRAVTATPSFSDRITHEAAQRFREKLERISTSRSTYLSGMLVFALLFTAAYILHAENLFRGYPRWQLFLQLGFTLLVVGFAISRLIKNVIAGLKLSFLRDANIAIGHQLQQLSAQGAYVFHDIGTARGVIDHVLVGQKGLYAINVIARRQRKRSNVRLQNNTLEFFGDDVAYSIESINEKNARLQKNLQGMFGDRVRLRSVIAVPGWDVGEQIGEQHLLVNERTIAVLSGWHDSHSQLMNEDVDALRLELGKRCGDDRPERS